MSSSPNTTPLTYNSYLTQVATMAVINTTTVGGIVQGVDASFNAIIPQMLNYAELRIQRDMDLLPSETTDATTYNLTAGSNQLAISVNDFVTVQTISVLDKTGEPYPLVPTTKEFLQNVYGGPGSAGFPFYFAPVGGDQATGGDTTYNFAVGPFPDQTYSVAITGTQRLPTLCQYSGNSTDASTKYTFISSYLPDLLLMASLIYISAFQRNFGRQSDDPAMALSYESQYQTLLKSAVVEEFRKKFEASGWSSQSPPVAATPTR